MAWLAVNENGTERAFPEKPEQWNDEWGYDVVGYEDHMDKHYVDIWVELPIGSIKKLTGETITWGNEPIEIK